MKEKIHYIQLAVIVYMMQSGVILFALPRLVAEAFGTNGWIAIIGISAIAIINLYLINLVYKKGNGRSVFVIAEEVLPKWSLVPLYSFIIINFSLLAVLIAKNYVLLIQLTMFPNLNPDILLVYVLIVAVFFLSKGIYNISKITLVFFFFTIWTLVLLFLIFPEFSFTRLTPFFFENATDPIGKGVEVYTAFLGYELVLFLMPYVQNDHRFGRAIIVGHLFTTLVYLSVCFVAMGFYSFEQLSNILYPTHALLKYMQTPLIERIENSVFAVFFLKIIVTVVFYYWAALQTAERMFPKINGKWLLLLLIVGSFMVALMTSVQREVNAVFNYLTHPQIIFSFLFPLFLLLLLWVKNLKTRREKKSA